MRTPRLGPRLQQYYHRPQPPVAECSTDSARIRARNKICDTAALAGEELGGAAGPAPPWARGPHTCGRKTFSFFGSQICRPGPARDHAPAWLAEPCVLGSTTRILEWYMSRWCACMLVSLVWPLITLQCLRHFSEDRTSLIVCTHGNAHMTITHTNSLRVG